MNLGSQRLRTEARELGATLQHARECIGFWELRTGNWFERLVEGYLREREARSPDTPDIPDAERYARSNLLIARACAVSGVSGIASGSACTAASVVAAESDWTLAIVSFPLAGLAAGAEMVFRALVQLRLTADLCDLYGVERGPDKTHNVLSLYATALEIEKREPETDDLGRSSLERILRGEGERLGNAVGSQLVGETVMRNVIPFVGIATAAIANVELTARLGRFLRDYLVRKRALDAALAGVDPAAQAAALEAVWAIFVADGPLDGHEAKLLASLVHQQPEEERAAVLASFATKDSGWLERLRDGAGTSPANTLRLLELAAAAPGEPGERQLDLVRRAAEALNQPYRPERISEAGRAFAGGAALLQKLKNSVGPRKSAPKPVPVTP